MIFVKGMQKVYIYEENEIERRKCFWYFEVVEENGEKMCKIYVDFFEENDIEKVVKQNYYNIFIVIKKCIGCDFNNINVFLSMICFEVK